MKVKLYIFTILIANMMFANINSTILPPDFSISYNSPSCIFAGSTIPVTLTDNNGTGIPIGLFSATPAGLIIDQDTGEVNAGASLPGSYIVKYTVTATTSRSTNLLLLNRIVPTFNSIGNVCQNSIAPVLPTISTNLVAGTWFPAIINTSAIGTISYVFTPNAGQCGQPTTINITISIPTTTPTFNLLTTSYCKNAAAQSLPSNSSNGVSGSWSPSTINTATVGQSTYVFTGTGQCIAPYSLVVSTNDPTIPNFTNIEISNNYQIIPTLNTTSPNGISGTWFPTSINATQSGTYAFTANSGQCATNRTITVSILYPQANVPPILQTCGNSNGFGVFQLSDNNPFINPSTNPLIAIDYYVTLADAQSIFNPSSLSTITFANTTAFNQTIYARVQDRTTANYRNSVVAVQLKVNATLQPIATAINNLANIYVDDFNNVIQTVTLSTIFQGNNFYQWYEGAVPLGGNSTTTSYLVNAYSGMAPRIFKVNVRKQLNLSCEGFSNTLTIGTIRVSSPAGNTTQYYNAGQTLANLVVSGSNIRWYSSQTGSLASLLPISTLLANGTTYYASQTIDGVQSPNIFGVTAVLNTLSNDFFQLNYVRFSPNSVADFLHIQSEKSIKNISIFNMLGQKIYDQKFNNLEMKIDLSNLVSGNYFMKVESDNKQIVSKIIKK